VITGEHQLREDRTRMKTEAAVGGLIDRDAKDVRRQQVAGELNALELQSEHARERERERGLADAGHVLDQQMSARQHAGQRQAQLQFLSEQDGAKRLQGWCECWIHICFLMIDARAV